MIALREIAAGKVGIEMLKRKIAHDRSASPTCRATRVG